MEQIGIHKRDILIDRIEDAQEAQEEGQLKATKRRYNRLITSMRDAEQTIDPVLSSLKDNVLYLKHNLNARGNHIAKG
jgi:hypothetical protein